jgi:hypothetical protein
MMNPMPTNEAAAPAASSQNGESLDVFEPSDSPDLPDTEQPAPTQTAQPAQAAPVQPSAQPPAPAVTLPEDQLQKIITQSYEMAQRNVQAQQPPPVATPVPTKEQSDEEFAKFFGVPKVDESLYVAILGMKPENPQQIQALNDFGQALVKQAVRVATFYATQKMREAEAKVAPYVAQLQQQSNTEEQKMFFTKYPDLEPHMDLIGMVKADAIRRGISFDTKEKAMDFLAQKTNAILEQIRTGKAPAAPGVTAQAGQNQSQTRMTPTNIGGMSSHGRGGTVDSNQLAKALKDSLDVFEE